MSITQLFAKIAAPSLAHHPQQPDSLRYQTGGRGAPIFNPGYFQGRADAPVVSVSNPVVPAVVPSLIIQKAQSLAKASTTGQKNALNQIQSTRKKLSIGAFFSAVLQHAESGDAVALQKALNNRPSRFSQAIVALLGLDELSVGYALNRALKHASVRGHAEVVKCLLQEKRIDVNSWTPDHQNLTPLMLAVKHGHEEIVRLLLDHPKIIRQLRMHSVAGPTSLGFAQIKLKGLPQGTPEHKTMSDIVRLLQNVERTHLKGQQAAPKS